MPPEAGYVALRADSSEAAEMTAKLRPKKSEKNWQPDWDAPHIRAFLAENGQKWLNLYVYNQI
jgi:hypothetical protein